MRDAFGWDLETYLYFGGYPGATIPFGEERASRNGRQYVYEIDVPIPIYRNLAPLRSSSRRQRAR